MTPVIILAPPGPFRNRSPTSDSLVCSLECPCNSYMSGSSIADFTDQDIYTFVGRALFCILHPGSVNGISQQPAIVRVTTVLPTLCVSNRKEVLYEFSGPIVNLT